MFKPQLVKYNFKNLCRNTPLYADVQSSPPRRRCLPGGYCRVTPLKLKLKLLRDLIYFCVLEDNIREMIIYVELFIAFEWKTHNVLYIELP